MAAKSRVARLESEIEKYRASALWGKVLDSAKQLSSKHSSLDNFDRLIQAECQLERFLMQHPPSDKNIPIAQGELRQPQREIQEVLDNDPKKNIRQEAMLLLGKIHFAMGDYSAALRRYEEVDLENFSIEKVPSRKSKLIGEAFAAKGLCLEKLPISSTSKYKLQEREEQIIKCFEKSGDISISQIQAKLERGSKTPNAVALTGAGFWNIIDVDVNGVGPIVETAIQRSPILFIRNGELSKGVNRFRELLRAVETRAIQGLRQTLARQLAEVLLRGVCERTYEQISLKSAASTPTTTTNHSTKPHKFAGDSLFVPSDDNEETILLLLISESIATKEAILTRSPEHEKARLHTFHNSTAVYDLLTIALVKRAQYNILSETFERAMKFSFDEFHIWYQYGLSLICAEKHTKALLVLKECMRLQKKNPTVYLLAAKLCYEKLHMVEEGIVYSTRATEIAGNPLKARSFVSLGVGYSLKADQSHLHINRQECQRKALHVFTRAVSYDVNDYLAHFHLALQQALLRQVPDAMKNVRHALHLQGDHIHSLHLLALLLSAQKQHQEALVLIHVALAEHPENFNLLFTKCKLEETVLGPETTLQTCRQMLKLWKSMFESSLDLDNQKMTGLMEHIMSADHRNLIQLQLSEVNDRDSGSIRVESIAASKVEQTLSEVASSLGSSLPPKQGPHQTWSLLTQIWLRLSELYLTLERVDSAHACIQEASNIFPISHTVSYMRGRLLEERGDINEAKNCYENAVAINPAHVKSLQHLGMVLYKMNNCRQAEKVLRDAVNVDPASSISWYNLGKVLESLGDFEAATECLMTSVELETSSSIVSFSVIPRPLS